MLCIRVLVLILCLIFTAAGTCSNLMVAFRKPGTIVGNTDLFFWFRDVTVPAGESVIITRTYFLNMDCEQVGNFFTAAGATAAAGTAFGGIATLLAVAHVSVRRKCCLCFGIVVMLLLATACFVTTVALTAITFTKDSCMTALPVDQWPSLKSQEFQIREGFVLACAAAGGFLITFILELFS